VPRDLDVSGIDPNRLAFRIGLRNSCHTDISLAEIGRGELREINIPCKIKKTGRYELRGYWFGRVPVVIDGVQIVRQQPDSQGK